MSPRETVGTCQMRLCVSITRARTHRCSARRTWRKSSAALCKPRGSSCPASILTTTRAVIGGPGGQVLSVDLPGSSRPSSHPLPRARADRAWSRPFERVQFVGLPELVVLLCNRRISESHDLIISSTFGMPHGMCHAGPRARKSAEAFRFASCHCCLPKWSPLNAADAVLDTRSHS